METPTNHQANESNISRREKTLEEALSDLGDVIVASMPFVDYENKKDNNEITTQKEWLGKHRKKA